MEHDEDQDIIDLDDYQEYDEDEEYDYDEDYYDPPFSDDVRNSEAANYDWSKWSVDKGAN